MKLLPLQLDKRGNKWPPKFPSLSPFVWTLFHIRFLPRVSFSSLFNKTLLFSVTSTSSPPTPTSPSSFLRFPHCSPSLSFSALLFPPLIPLTTGRDTEPKNCFSPSKLANARDQRFMFFDVMDVWKVGESNAFLPVWKRTPSTTLGTRSAVRFIGCQWFEESSSETKALTEFTGGVVTQCGLSTEWSGYMWLTGQFELLGSNFIVEKLTLRPKHYSSPLSAYTSCDEARRHIWGLQIKRKD